MALKKSKNLHNEIVAEYWKITSLSVNRLSKVLSADISLFKNKSFSGAGQPPFMKHSASKKFTSEELAGDLTALAYGMFKEIAAEPIAYGLVPDRNRQLKADLANSEDV